MGYFEKVIIFFRKTILDRLQFNFGYISQMCRFTIIEIVIEAIKMLVLQMHLLWDIQVPNYVYILDSVLYILSCISTLVVYIFYRRLIAISVPIAVHAMVA